MMPMKPETLEDALLYIDVRAAVLKSLARGIHDASASGRGDALAMVQDMLFVLEDEISLLEAEIEDAEKLTNQGLERIKERRGHILDFRESTHTK